MKEYKKPIIEEEVIIIEDIMTASNGGEGNAETGGQSRGFDELFD